MALLMVNYPCHMNLCNLADLVRSSFLSRSTGLGSYEEKYYKYGGSVEDPLFTFSDALCVISWLCRAFCACVCLYACPTAENRVIVLKLRKEKMEMKLVLD